MDVAELLEKLVCTGSLGWSAPYPRSGATIVGAMDLGAHLSLPASLPSGDEFLQACQGLRMMPGSVILQEQVVGTGGATSS